MNLSWLRRTIVGIAIAAVAVQGVTHAIKPVGDFQLHWNWGLKLRTGVPLYDEGGVNPYPPAWAVPHVPLSLVSMHIAKPAFLVIGVASLCLLLCVLNALTRTAFPVAHGQLFWVNVAALLLAGRFVHRDFDDGGQNLVLLTLSWIAIWLVAQDRPWSAGISLGCATALKCTAGLFIVYFVLKRQWRMVLSSTVWTALFSISPILWQGPNEFFRQFQMWQTSVVQSTRISDPSHGILGMEGLQNKSLRPSLARYLMNLKPGHTGRHYVDQLPEGDPNRTPHPWSVDFLDLDPATAGWIIKGLMLAGIVGVGWLFRRPHAPGNEMVLVWEASIVSILTLLYSPITWGQHCVAVLPAVYLLARSVIAERVQSRWLTGFLVGFFLLVMLTNRTIIGKNLALLIESYHPLTFAFIPLAVVTYLVGRHVSGTSPSKLIPIDVPTPIAIESKPPGKRAA